MAYPSLSDAIEVLEVARIEILSIEANASNRATLDAAFNGLKAAQEPIAKLLECDQTCHSRS